MADRVILMRSGRIEQNDPPAALYERPHTVFAARFVGSPPMNVLPAEIIAQCGALAASSPARRDLGRMVLGVRPESVRLAATGLPARVVAVEYLGAVSQIETRAGEATVMLRTAGALTVAPGQMVHLAWEAADAHWFDASSQCRVA